MLGLAGAPYHLEFTRKRGHMAAYNPYWGRLGRTYEDPDGYRVAC